MGHLFQSWKSYRGFPLISLRSGILVEKNRSSCFPLIICSQKAKSVAGLEYSKQTFPFWSFNCKVIYMISEKCVVCFSCRRRIFILLLTKHREKKTPTLVVFSLKNILEERIEACGLFFPLLQNDLLTSAGKTLGGLLNHEGIFI